jgi:hypothetical protein
MSELTIGKLIEHVLELLDTVGNKIPNNTPIKEAQKALKNALKCQLEMQQHIENVIHPQHIKERQKEANKRWPTY